LLAVFVNTKEGEKVCLSVHDEKGLICKEGKTKMLEITPKGNVKKEVNTLRSV